MAIRFLLERHKATPTWRSHWRQQHVIEPRVEANARTRWAPLSVASEFALGENDSLATKNHPISTELDLNDAAS